jgi:5-formyltetrahydrofolate cyclo-ligase
MGNATSSQRTLEAELNYRRTLRRSLIARRLALPAEECERLSIALSGHLRETFGQLAAMRVAFCWPVRNEPDLRPLLAEWRAASRPGFAALLPVVLREHAALAFRSWSPESLLAPDRYGIPTPVSGAFIKPEALLLPVNGFDAAGYRLGYGGGYFDRTLAALRSSTQQPLTIGVGFELARVDSIRPEAHDLALDAMVTEAGVYWTPALGQTAPGAPSRPAKA